MFLIVFTLCRRKTHNKVTFSINALLMFTCGYILWPSFYHLTFQMSFLPNFLAANQLHQYRMSSKVKPDKNFSQNFISFSCASWNNWRKWGARGAGQHTQPHLCCEKLPGEAALPAVVPQKWGLNPNGIRLAITFILQTIDYTSPRGGISVVNSENNRPEITSTLLIYQVLKL